MVSLHVYQTKCFWCPITLNITPRYQTGNSDLTKLSNCMWSHVVRLPSILSPALSPTVRMPALWGWYPRTFLDDRRWITPPPPPNPHPVAVATFTATDNIKGELGGVGNSSEKNTAVCLHSSEGDEVRASTGGGAGVQYYNTMYLNSSALEQAKV